ncbi:lycopene cyclase family protein [Limnovirga soli]|uniref:lycopene cyclase family protein n=1 Tax=Limnovirga soli TaxID=2656915 RepID=UPI001491E4B1|nr:lycopene cyclase family protein [Limnovirga soli]
MKTQYDYIISGAGCAGLSLLYRMMQHPFFTDKEILVIDNISKNTNDRTWCFWEQQTGPFEHLVHHQWKDISFYSNNFSGRFNIAPYTYKMIRGIDFYTHILEQAHKAPNIYFATENILSAVTNANTATVITDRNTYTAGYVFNSIIFPDHFLKQASPQHPNAPYKLLQHFKGWFIETEEPLFEKELARFMDFRVHQQHGTSFVYVLPLSTQTALVEYTLFTSSLLASEAYDDALANYMQENYPGKAYNIQQKEFGVIPMTSFQFSPGDDRLVALGTAGGQTKASSGFTFRFIQKHSDAIIAALLNGHSPIIKKSWLQKRFDLYDATLLHILTTNKMGGDAIFETLFKKNTPQSVLRFLDNESTLLQDMRLMSTVPTSIFLPAALRQLLH